jgi:ligand-binding sensor domain-containing protein
LKKATLLILIIRVIMAPVFPLSSSIHFKHITLEDGLSQSSIFCIMQDCKGFLWFGTQDGLNKYDGYHFTIFKPDPEDPNSLSSTLITSIYEDSAGFLWIGTNGGGLNRFDPRTKTFYRYPANPKDPNRINNQAISCICPDKTGALWIGTFGDVTGIYVLTRTGTLQTQIKGINHYQQVPNDPNSLSHNLINWIYEDRSGVVWVGTGGGLNRFNRETNTFTHYQHISDDPESLSHNNVTRIYEDRSGMFWVGTGGGGLNLMNRKTGKFFAYRYNPNDINSLSQDIISAIYDDRSGVLWIGTQSRGLNRFDKRSETFSCYRKVPNEPHSLSSDIIFSIYEDRSRILWIGTQDAGLNKFIRENKFQHIRAEPNTPNSLSSNFIYAIFEDHLGIAWIGTNGDGLNRFDRKTGTYIHYRNNANDPTSLGSNIVRAIYEDRSGVLWVGTANGGLNEFHRETETFSRYLNIPNDPNSLSNNTVRTIYEDRSGTFWVGTTGGGLNKFNRQTGTAVRYETIANDPTSISGNSISVIIESIKEPGILWIGTLDGGVNRFDPISDTFRRYTADPNNPHSLSGNIAQSVCEDRSGTIWVGTFGSGLNKLIFDKNEKHRFKHYTEKHGLPNNSIYGVLEDREGCLWISTNKGLSRFDPHSETFKNYNVWDGLQGNEFNGGAYHKSKSGEMFFGGLNGFNVFYPSRIENNPHIPPLVITAFRLFNKPTPIGPDSPLQKSIEWTDQIRLSHHQNVFLFEFSALDFTVPENNQYAYMLEGFSQDWVITDSQKRFASYTNLAPGQYTFRVRGSNNDGVWNKTGTSIKIIITPPYWRTWWFQLLVLCLAAGMVILWYRKRLKTVRIKTELQTAHDAQMSIMPQSDPQIDGFDISGICVPANEVGGDFFDYLWMNVEKTKFGIAIGDVSGKAMKSAMTAVMTSGMIYLEADEALSVKEIMTRVNRPLFFKTEKKVFTALCLACLDIHTNELTFTNAGLNGPLLKSGDSVSRLESTGNKLPLGIKLDSVYLEKKHLLAPGDVVIFFTDGITETKNQEHDFFGFKRLKTLLETIDVAALTAGEIKNAIINNVKQFAQAASQYDDMTVVVVKVL